MKLKKDASRDKLRGGFYTPSIIANYIVRIVSQLGYSGNFLEPSCGDGEFLRSIVSTQIPYKSIVAVELDQKESEKSSSLNLPNCEVLNRDFFKYCLSEEKRFDVIVGNPPFIRYQFLDSEQQEMAEMIFSKANLKYSKLTNAWVSFVVGCSLLLKEKGIMGFVIPAELLQVGYAAVLRDYLAHSFNKVTFVTFEKLVFPDIQQEVLLLFCEKDGSDSHLVGHIEVKNEQELVNIDCKNLRDSFQEFDFASCKWTSYFLNEKEKKIIEYLRKKLKTIGDYAKVEVGMTTGANPYFTVNKNTVENYDLKKYAFPLVGRSVQVPSVILTKHDWCTNQESGVRSNILIFPSIKDIKSTKVKEYLKLGEESKVNEGYKCRIRDEWQIIPSAWVSDALFIRRNNLFPKLIKNETKAFTTDTMHRVSIKEGVSLDALVASYYNSISFAFAELSGRSHGGGVLELMPNEVENILLPYHEDNSDLLKKINEMFRSGCSIDEVLEFTNPIILKKHFGCSDDDIKLINGIWKKLQQRRLGRGK